MQSLALNEMSWGNGSVALIVQGVIDDDTVAYFEDQLDAAFGSASRRLIVDLTACRLASAGLAALIRFWRRSGSRATAMSLVASGVDLRMLQIVGLASKFRIFTTLDAALVGFRPAAIQRSGWRR